MSGSCERRLKGSLLDTKHLRSKKVLPVPVLTKQSVMIMSFLTKIYRKEATNVFCYSRQDLWIMKTLLPTVLTLVIAGSLFVMANSNQQVG